MSGPITGVLRWVKAAGRALAGAALFAGFAACAAEAPPPPPAATRPPEITKDPETGRHRLELSVMTYNVWGLPWPAATGRPAALRRIAEELRQLQEAGEAPDLLLLQEAFTGRARRIGALAGYPYRLSGPRAGDRPTLELPPPPPELRGAPRILRGEGLGKLLSSGLEIYSRYALAEVGMMPFGRRICAGLDCLANKGVMLATVEIPGVPEPVQILNTHLNAGKKSGVALDRAHAAHRSQLEQIGLLLERALRPDRPFIFAGDFNTRNSEERFDNKDTHLPGHVVRRYCTRRLAECEVRMSWDDDEPWMDTQDLQGFASGTLVRVRPLRVQAMFDEPRDGRRLSDHDAYLVVYELSWPARVRE